MFDYNHSISGVSQTCSLKKCKTIIDGFGEAFYEHSGRFGTNITSW